MKLFTLISTTAFFVLSHLPARAQVMVSYSLELSLNQNQLDSFYNAEDLPGAILPQSHGVDVYRVVYNTVSYDGTTPTVASGLLCIPKNKTCASPLIAYMHGTILKKTAAPSNLLGEYIIGVAMAADGYVSVMPDYLGLGASPGIHPYVHYESQATASRDMIRAGREICQQLNVALNGQVFLTGYSQGGHAALGTHKYLQENHPLEFQVTASVPMSGPYSLSEVMRDLILSNEPYSNPEYLPMVIMTYREVYNIYPDLSTAIVAPYDTLLPVWTSGTYSNNWVGNKMNQMGANPPKLIVKPEVLDTFSTDSTHILRVLLKENDVYRWLPEAPVRFLYCSADEQVSYINSIKAHSYMQNAGAQNLSIHNVDDQLDHFNCAQYAILDMRGFFEPMRHDKIQLLTQQYQPASGPNSADGSVTLELIGGATPVEIVWSNGQTGLTASGLAPGVYSATATGADGCSSQISITINYTLGELSSHSSVVPDIFPNPGIDFISIRNLNGPFNLKNMAGTTILSGHLFTDAEIVNISDLKAGAYVFTCGNFRRLFIKHQN